MLDPVTPGVDVPFRGKTYRLQLTNGACAMASGAPGVPPIIEGGDESVFTKPEFFQRGVFLFALVYQKFPTATLAECMELVTGPKAEYYGKILAESIKELAPAIKRLHGGEVKGTPPLAESSSGGDSGPALVSTSIARTKSSGPKPQGKPRT